MAGLQDRPPKRIAPLLLVLPACRRRQSSWFSPSPPQGTGTPVVPLANTQTRSALAWTTALRPMASLSAARARAAATAPSCSARHMHRHGQRAASSGAALTAKSARRPAPTAAGAPVAASTRRSRCRRLVTAAAYSPYPFCEGDYHRVGLQMVQVSRRPRGEAAAEPASLAALPHVPLRGLSRRLLPPAQTASPAGPGVQTGYFLLMRTNDREAVEDPGGQGAGRKREEPHAAGRRFSRPPPILQRRRRLAVRHAHP